jgi:predicted transposase YdaD
MIGIQEIELKQTRFYQDVFNEGRQEGKLEGKLEGRLEGELSVLQRLLERKFGPVDAAVRNRLLEADTETLLLWSEKVLEATTLDEVFSTH